MEYDISIHGLNKQNNNLWISINSLIIYYQCGNFYIKPDGVYDYTELILKELSDLFEIDEKLENIVFLKIKDERYKDLINTKIVEYILETQIIKMKDILGNRADILSLIQNYLNEVVIDNIL